MTLLQDPLFQYEAFALAVAVPVARIFGRAGFRRPWAALPLLAVPMAGLLLCAAVLALVRWPVLPLESGGRKE